MRNIKPTSKTLFTLFAVMVLVVACDKDFISLDSDITGNSNFGVADKKYEVIAYNKKLGPVQTNRLPVNMLGVYKDLVYGNTTASFVTSLAPVTNEPTFPEDTRIDSVVVTIPYFSTSTGVVTEEGTTYRLDSIYGDKPFNFKIYESNFFLRNFDPNTSFNSPQKYYSDRSISGSSQIPLSLLRGTLIESVTDFTPSDKEIKTLEEGELTRSGPAIRLKLDTDFWYNKIILKQGSAELKNLNNFQNYFRGLYFEAEAVNDDGSMFIFDLRPGNNANIVIHYSSPPTVTDGDRINGKYVMNFSDNRVNFFDNEFTLNIPDGNADTGDEKLFLKGGEGSIAIIKLFEGTDIDINGGTVTAFDAFKNDFVETDADGKFVRTKRLVNEANLVFYVAQELTQGQEPDRIYIYDTKNKQILADYFYDQADANIEYSKINHLGRLQRESDDKNAKGVKYKIKITEHIKNLLFNDSTNVSLGLAVSLNINSEAEYDSTQEREIPTPHNSILMLDDTPANSVPVTSIVSPKGTVLYGNNTDDLNKKLYLEIFYTEPNN